MSTAIFQKTDLGSAESIVLVIEALAQTQKALPVSDVKKFCASKSADLAYSLSGILELLIFIEWLKKTRGGAIGKGKKFPEELIEENDIENIKEQLIYGIFASLMERKLLANFIDQDAIDYSLQKSKVTVLKNSIPLQESGLKNFLGSVGFFVDSLENPYSYCIDDKYQDYFEKEVIAFLREFSAYTPEIGLSYERFKEIQVAKELAGLEAEEFVMKFEKRRLFKHPLTKNIKQISKIKVNAGYDIASFESITSKKLDRYIEVKSFAGVQKFYWSKNEVEVAQLNSQKYYLYLVDRKRISEPDYSPVIICDPYKIIFEDDEWNKEAQNWLVKKSAQT